MGERVIECPVCSTEHALDLHGPVVERVPEEPSKREYDPLAEHINRVTCDHTAAEPDDFWVVYRLEDAGG